MPMEKGGVRGGPEASVLSFLKPFCNRTIAAQGIEVSPPTSGALVWAREKEHTIGQGIPVRSFFRIVAGTASTASR